MNKAYEEYNQNAGGLFVFAIYNAGSDATCTSYNKTKGVKYPTVSNKSGGQGIINDYTFVEFFASYVLINPDKEVMEKNVYPNGGGHLIKLLDKYNIQSTDIIDNEDLQTHGKTALADVLISQDSKSRNINLYIPVAGSYTIRAYSVNGKENGFINSFFSKGMHRILSDTRLSSQNITLFEIRCGNSKVIKKLVGIQ